MAVPAMGRRSRDRARHHIHARGRIPGPRTAPSSREPLLLVSKQRALGPRVQEISDGLVAGLGSETEADLLTACIRSFASRVMRELIGLPVDQGERSPGFTTYLPSRSPHAGAGLAPPRKAPYPTLESGQLHIEVMGAGSNGFSSHQDLDA